MTALVEAGLDPRTRARNREARIKAGRALIEEKRQNPNEPFLLDDVLVRYVPWDSTRTTQTTLLYLGPDGVLFGSERVHVPWSFLEKMTTWHVVYTALLDRSKARWYLKQAGIKGGEVFEDAYADPKRWHIGLGPDVLDVVKLWKVVMSDNPELVAKWERFKAETTEE